jgi:hypothetical protein
MKFPAFSTEPERSPVVTKKRQRCRLIRIVCPDPSCGIIARIARVHIDRGNTPLCGACGKRMVARLPQ